MKNPWDIMRPVANSFVEVGDSGILIDIDDPNSYRRLK